MAFIQDLVIKEDLTEYNTNVIPIKTSFSIKMIESNSYEEAESWLYYCFIGKLMYLVYGTRSDIAFAVRQLSKYNSNPRKNHLQVVKKVVQYLKGTMQLRLVYG